MNCGPDQCVPQELQPDVGELFFADTRFRPDPSAVARLILRGANEEMIRSAALERDHRLPKYMYKTANDLQLALPYIKLISDGLVASHEGAQFLYAGRDAEALFDYSKVACPNLDIKLLPASRNLWVSEGMHDPCQASDFLRQYGIDEQTIKSPTANFVLVDTGFKGSIGKTLDSVVERLYGVSLLGRGALQIKLVCAADSGYGSPIITLPPDKQASLSSKLLGIRPVVSEEWFPNLGKTNTFSLAANLQMMPRFHGAYDRLQRTPDGGVLALPTDLEKPRDYVDQVDLKHNVNDSVINPVAAAIIQLRVVGYAMQQCGLVAPHK